MTAPNFNSIDVETANADRASICQIGIVHVRDGRIADTWQSLIDPEDWFDFFNEQIHGITKEDVQGAPTLPQVRAELRRRLRGSIVVSHTSFDRVAFERAMDKYGLNQLDVKWLDTTKVVRRAWPEQYAVRRYGLSSVASDLGIDFQHHDALEDARAAAEIMLRACADTGIAIEPWLDRVKRTIHPSNSSRRLRRKPVVHEANQEAALYGETVVFTGSLSMVRREAVDLAAKAGCAVQPNVTKNTTLLVVGVQDKNSLSGYEKSSKHRKAEQQIRDGIALRILSEDDFMAMLGI